MTRAWEWGARRLPQGWLDALRQLMLFAGAYYVYRIVRGATDGNANVAFENARNLVDIERSSGLFFEPGLQDWALHNARFLVDAGNFMYVNSHFVVTTTFLIWLYLVRNASFYYVRNVFMIGMGLALIGYLVYPTAPPRYLPEWGFTDTVARFVGEEAADKADLLYNPFAAVPSMHVAFALMVGIPAIRLVRSRALKVAWAAYPLLVTFVVVVTANHFWMDAVFGAATAAVAGMAASAALARARPEAWAWRTATVRAEASA